MSTDPAEALARKMAEDDRPGTWEPLLPYARALIQAEKALAAIEDVRTPNDAAAADHLRAPALAALRAAIGQP